MKPLRVRVEYTSDGVLVDYEGYLLQFVTSDIHYVQGLVVDSSGKIRLEDYDDIIVLDGLPSTAPTPSHKA